MMPDGSASSQKLSDLPIFESNFASSRLGVQIFNLSQTLKHTNPSFLFLQNSVIWRKFVQ